MIKTYALAGLFGFLIGALGYPINEAEFWYITVPLSFIGGGTIGYLGRDW